MMNQTYDRDAAVIGDRRSATDVAAQDVLAHDQGPDPLAPFRATQRLPRTADPVPPEPDPLPPSPGPLRWLVPVLVGAVGLASVAIAWPLLEAPVRRAPLPASAQPSPEPTPRPWQRGSVPGPGAQQPSSTFTPPPPRLSPVSAPPPTVTVVVVVTAAPAPHATPSPTASGTPSGGLSGWTFSLAGVGPLHLGMPAQAAADAGYLVADPGSAGGFVTSPALAEELSITLADGVVDAVRITAPSVRSAEGVTVGTPLSALPEAFGAPLTWLPVQSGSTTADAPAIVGPTSHVIFVPQGGVVGSIVVGLHHPASPSASPSATPTPTTPGPTGTPTTPGPTGTPSAGSAGTPSGTPETPSPSASPSAAGQALSG